jgi:hypothetical protein
VSDKSTIEWTDATCSTCGVPLTTENRAEPGRKRCRPCRNSAQRERYIPKGRPLRSGPMPVPARDGDKRQARKRVNQMVLCGRLPRPNDVPCFDCGHRFNGTMRHEYDHFLGYAAHHHLAVQVVCSRCHHRRAEERGETPKVRRVVGVR